MAGGWIGIRRARRTGLLEGSVVVPVVPGWVGIRYAKRVTRSQAWIFVEPPKPIDVPGSGSGRGPDRQRRKRPRYWWESEAQYNVALPAAEPQAQPRPIKAPTLPAETPVQKFRQTLAGSVSRGVITAETIRAATLEAIREQAARDREAAADAQPVLDLQLEDEAVALLLLLD